MNKKLLRYTVGIAILAIVIPVTLTSMITIEEAVNADNPITKNGLVILVASRHLIR
ncbi:MAG: hypothetical protein IPI62_13320 [Bacteroidetes bacterium]|nr:hypothetical protein [Bacteroidota bacterium]